MKLNAIKNALTSSTTRKVLLAKKNSPAILFVAGTGAVVTSTVMACNATLKLHDILDEANKDRVRVEEAMSMDLGDQYTEKDQIRDLRVLKIQTAVKVGKNYAPALAVGTFGLICLTGAHVVLSNRNTALMAAYAALDKGFKEYQDRVREAFGPEREKELRMDGERVKVKDPETGKDQMLTRARLAGEHSIYARLWDHDTSSSYQKVPEYNLAFLTAKQNYLNDRLRARGHVLLNDAYDELGLERTKEGCVVGWVKNGEGDNFIDFGIFGGDGGAVLDFVTGVEGGIWLDFNVDGIVYDKI